MNVNKHFIQEIRINKVRHHKNISIPIDDHTSKHLIITGKNGSGKTSLLEGIKDFLTLFENYSIPELLKWKELVLYNDLELSNNVEDYYTQDRMRRDIENFTTLIDNYCGKIELNIKNSQEIHHLFQEGRFLLAYFNASRACSMLIPKGVEKINLEKKYTINDDIAHLFLKYLVDLKTQATFARQEQDIESSKKLEDWFDYIEQNLKFIFENENLKLKFDYRNYNFQIIEPGKDPYDLTTLSSGFSSILSIVTELILRMEGQRTEIYDIEGIVIIDEIEAHLHVTLQKKIFKFLTDFFPNVQFIISTHSPFVLNSVSNAVIYDLHEKIAYEDFSNYSYKSIVEDFLGVDQYSSIVKEKLKEYELLTDNFDSLNPTEHERLNDLNEYLDNESDPHSKELQLKKAYIDLQRILEGDQE